MGIAHIVVGTGTAGTRFLKSDYPVEEGLTAGTTYQSEEWKLEPVFDNTKEKDRVGLE